MDGTEQGSVSSEMQERNFFPAEVDEGNSDRENDENNNMLEDSSTAAEVEAVGIGNGSINRNSQDAENAGTGNQETKENDDNHGEDQTGDIGGGEETLQKASIDPEEDKAQEDDPQADPNLDETVEAEKISVTQEGGAEDSVPMGNDKIEEAEAADPNIENNSESLVPTPTPATKIRLGTRKHTTTPADDSGLAQPVLPNIGAHRGQANVHQMTNSITHARRRQDGLLPASKQPVRARVPPKLVRLATVTVSPARTRHPRTTSLYYEEPRKPAKVITWDQAYNHRPPLRIDMEGPGPCSYSPLNKPLGETNAPCYTFGTKCYPEKEGGARTSWGKSWFQSSHLYHNKADYAREGLWPSPNHYPKAPLLGPRQRTMTEAPSFTFGHKQAFSIVKPGAAKEPSPNDYERQNADRLVLRRGPSFTHQFRREGTVLWGSSERTPAPCSYTMDHSPRIHRPAYTIQGIRREKSHVLGPYSTL